MREIRWGLNRLGVWCSVAIVGLASSGCLEDGRPEAEYLREYARFAPDTGVMDAGNPIAADAVVVTTMESDRCSTEAPSDPPFVTLRNTTEQLFQIHQSLPDCTEFVAKQLQPRSRIGIDMWPGAVWRLRDESGAFVVEIQAGSRPYPTDEIEVP